MSDAPITLEVDVPQDDPPLITDDAGCGDGAEGPLEFDEAGSVVLPVLELPPLARPCSLRSLDGSWLMEISGPGPLAPFGRATRGPMRIEARGQLLRISGDVYVSSPVIGPVAGERDPRLPLGTLMIRRNWYPAFPQGEYRWYFRSAGVRYDAGALSFDFERQLWDAASQEFTSVDRGTMSLTCQRLPVRPPWSPRETVQMTGTAVIGGRRHSVTATKTSPFYRGCALEVDVFTNRAFPVSGAGCDGISHTFASVYRAAGLDFVANVNETSIPEDAELTMAELHALLAAHQAAATGSAWRLWLLIGSRMEDDTFGIMFDSGNPPHREGAVGFADPTLPDNPIIEAGARGQALGQVPLAFLRTLVHEAGHAFNLFHPKHDVHSVPVGTTIMNQTGDVMDFSTAANPYPCTATMAFDDHNRTSLIHSPDPQVKPGWKEFGWGHSTTFAGVAEPVDSLGLRGADGTVEGIGFELFVPEQVHRGEFVVGTVIVTNTGDAARRVPAGLNLAEGNLWLVVSPPQGGTIEVRDVVLACGPRRMVELEPGESLSGQFELFYNSGGFTFDQPGTYRLQAELDLGETAGTVVRSEPATLVLRPAISEPERGLERLAVDDSVGLSLAFGDTGADPAAQERVTAVMEEFPETDTGAACALTLVNTAARAERPAIAGDALPGARRADPGLADRALGIAQQGRSAVELARLACAVASPVERGAPVLARVRDAIGADGADGGYDDQDADAARRIIEDHVA